MLEIVVSNSETAIFQKALGDQRIALKDFLWSCGGVYGYVAQAILKINTEIAWKGRFRMETKLEDAMLVENIEADSQQHKPPCYLCPGPDPWRSNRMIASRV